MALRAGSNRFTGYLAQNEIWPVAFLILVSLLLPSLLPLAVVVAVLFWLVRWVAYRRLTIRTPVDWPLGLLGITILVTWSVNALPGITQPQAYRLLSGMALFYAIVNWGDSSKRVRWLLLGACLVGLGLVSAAPFSVQWVVGKLPFIPNSIFERFSVLVSDAIHPNVLAGSLILLIPLVLGWLLFDWAELNWLARMGLAMTVLAMLAVLILSESRGAWIAIVISCALMMILRWRWAWAVVLVAGLAAAFGIHQFGVSEFLDLLASGTSIGGIDGRLEIWSRALFMIQDFPFTGIGLGSFGRVADEIYPFYLAAPGSIPHAHNLFLQVAVDLGMPGLVAWLAILLGVLAATWKVFRLGKRTDSGWITGLGAGLLCSQVAFLTHGLFDAVTWGMVRPAPLVWGIWGISIAALLIYDKKNN